MKRSGQIQYRFLIDMSLLIGLSIAVIVVQILDRSNTKVDLVFVIDQQFDMKDALDAIKTNCVEKAQSLYSTGSDCRFAVIAFGGKQKRVPDIPLTKDLSVFRHQLKEAVPETTPTWPASSYEAMQQVLSFDFRQDASVIVFLISRIPFTDDGEFGSITEKIKKREIVMILQADAAEKERCNPLYQNGGRFYSMEGEDLTDSSSSPSKTGNQSGNSSQTANLLARISPDKTETVSGIGRVKGIFSLRTAVNRAQLVANLGGSHESELAVQNGLEWLARHQADDGSWSDALKCERDRPCDQLKFDSSGAVVAETGLAILAFQAGGNYDFNEHKYSTVVKKGLDWLVNWQKEDGRLFGTHSWYEHGIATFAIAEACAVAVAEGETPDPRYVNTVELAIKFLEAHQYEGGGWQYAIDSGGMGDTSVTGWQMLALKSAIEAKIEVAPRTIEKLKLFFEKVGDPTTGKTGYQSRGGGTDLTTAVGLIFQEFILKQPHSPFAEKGTEFLTRRATTVAESGSYYSIYNCTLAVFLAKGENWKQWNETVRDAIVKKQSKSGCARGSWAGDYGRTLSTTWAILTLEVYYRYASEEETK